MPVRKTISRILIPILFICFTGFAGCDLTPDSDHGHNNNFTLIDEKLEKQFDLYDQAHQKIINAVVDENAVVLREEWESWLRPEPEDALSEGELEAIRSRQQETIRVNRRKAMASSSLDLNLIRNNADDLADYCRELPKGGMLHIHPSGTRNKPTVTEILEEVNPLINGQDILARANDGNISKLYPEEIEFWSDLPVMNYLDYNEANRNRILDFFFLPENPPSHDFKRFEAIFKIDDLLDQDESKKQWVEEKTYRDFLKRCADQNVSYVEFTRVMWPNPATFAQLHTWARQWYLETGITVRWNCAFIRTLDYATNTAWTQELISVLTDNSYPELVGIDLLANETDTPALETGQNIYIPILYAAQQKDINLKQTMHAGELGLVHNVRDAMIMGVDRVGHGVLLASDPLGLEYAAHKKSLPIAINIYSNYRLQVNDDFSRHPFLDFLRLGLPVSLATDDEGIFISDITNEVRLAIRYSDITHQELKQMSYNAIETSFASDEVKTGLLTKLDDDFAIFEAKWGNQLTNPGGSF